MTLSSADVAGEEATVRLRARAVEELASSTTLQVNSAFGNLPYKTCVNML